MMQRLRIMVLVLVVGCWIMVAPAAFAQRVQPQTSSSGLVLFTRYPAQEVAIDEIISFPLTLRATDALHRVQFETRDLPKGWTATFRGDGRVVQAVYVEPEKEASVDLRVEPSGDVSGGTYRFTVIARADGAETSLPLELILKDKPPANLHFDVELPKLRGNPQTAFRYNLTLRNEGDQELSVNLLAEAPQGVRVDFQLAGQSVTSIPLGANESKSLSIEAKLFPDMPAGEYPFEVVAQGGELRSSATLIAEVTGQPELSLSAPDGRLSGQAYAGDKTPLKLVVQNTGSAPARNIKLNGSPPAGWTVTFEPEQIPELPSGQSTEVTLNVQPTDQALPGDYMVTVNANTDDGAFKSTEFRITVLTSTIWGVVGVGLIAVAVVVVGLAVTRFGRR